MGNEQQYTFEVFPWNENLETDITIVDEQHKELVALLNQLSNTLVSDDVPELTRIFDKLAAYAKHHFETEEAIWAQYFGEDSWFIEHQQGHELFLPTVLELKQEQGNKSLHDIVEYIVKFLIRWLAFHIIDNDKRMAIVVHGMDSGLSLEAAKSAAEEQMEGATKTLIDTVLNMYDRLSSRTLELMRERLERKQAEENLLMVNRELEKMAITDQLTGLFNRRYFVEVFEHELGRAKREQRYLTFIMFDVDNFKQLNDHYGHAQGDMALKAIGEKLHGLCRRPGDFAFRLGGEEFGLLITDETSEHGAEFAERIRCAIEQLAVPNVKSGVEEHMTVSLGVIAKVPDSSDTMDAFMSVADSRLYRAKSLGRNRAVTSD